MSIYSVGKIIKEARIRRNISQEILCNGLCSTPTLSKIESCKQNPNKKLMEALLQRLGLPIGIYNVSVSSVEFKRSLIETEIRAHLAKREDITDLLEEYRTAGKEMGALEKQFYLFVGANNQDTKTYQKILLEALRQTVPNFTLDTPLTQMLLTETELMILFNLSKTFLWEGDAKTMEKLCYNIKAYLETQEIDNAEKSKILPHVLLHLANLEEKMGNFEKEAELAQQGIDCCIQYGKLSQFDRLMYTKGFALAKLDRLKEAKVCFLRAFTLMATLNTPVDFRKEGLAEVESEFSITFTPQQKLAFLD